MDWGFFGQSVFALPSQCDFRSTTINAPVEKVFDQHVDASERRQALVITWLEMDPAAQYSYGKESMGLHT
ncbi:MAG: hypothetical protein R3A45_02655 [Bdellovibrionota bacterium]